MSRSSGFPYVSPFGTTGESSSRPMILSNNVAPVNPSLKYMWFLTSSKPSMPEPIRLLGCLCSSA
eukprot:CAMPEP_0172753804 /NCGR_PEP_ID=MMETSP1074-20121228/156708_1 /TAXON_ID=2916 /ORGANISM="Ceratium fusus, Strain PA161109" /LENGTH=64 /DNA_ID=CAMNT_0013586567 /DNA_START=185 /DNA_END=379 /DNA_ORIENTATION=-